MKQNIIALCGPSGVGKGYTKKLIKEAMSGVEFSEPVVATTRAARPSDGPSRLSGLTEKQFMTMVKVGMIVLPHRPFGENTDLYGFVSTSLQGKNILTEVHPSIINEFIEYFNNQNIMIYGFKASENFLFKVLEDRGDTKDIKLRVEKSCSEVAQIEEATKSGKINKVFEINLQNRDNVQSQIVEEIKAQIIAPHLEVISLEKQDNNSLLRTSFLGKTFSSPLVIASGQLTENITQIEEFIKAGAGAVVPRTTRLEMIRKKHPSPNLYQRNDSFINSQWTGNDIEYWKKHFDYLKENSEKIIMSVSGRNIKDCVKVCKELDFLGFPAFEINISCAASSGVHGQITKNINFVTDIVKNIKDSGVNTPISLKLGHSDGILEIANAAKEAGTDAITAINTFGPVFDFAISSNGKPKRILGIEGAKGGLSGSALFNIALTDVAEISRQVKVPVIASGGVMSPEDAVKMIMSGASLVQLYTKLHFAGNKAPNEFSKFNQEMLKFLTAHNIKSLETLRGEALFLLDLPTNLINLIPNVDNKKCKKCKLCMQMCLNKAVYLKNNDITINSDDCKGCGHCVSVCPENALTI